MNILSNMFCLKSVITVFLLTFCLFASAQYKGELCCVCGVDKSGSPFFCHLSLGYEVSFHGVKYSRIHGDEKDISYYCRIENGKLLRYDTTNEEEFTVCDFGLRQGDEFVSRTGTRYVVDTVTDTLITDPLYLTSRTFRLLRLHNMENLSDHDEWLENVGSLNTAVLLPSEICSDCNESRLLWWQERWAEFSIINPVNTDRMKGALMNVQWRSTEWDDRDDSIHCEFVKDTLVVSGRLSSGGCLFPYLSCLTEGKDIVLKADKKVMPVAATKSTLLFTNRFSGFRPGTYTIRYQGKPDVTLTCVSLDDVSNGDVNSDGKTDISDVVAIINVMAGTDDNTGTDMNASAAVKAKADVNHDGKTDISDITAVINIMAGQK